MAHFFVCLVITKHSIFLAVPVSDQGGIKWSVAHKLSAIMLQSRHIRLGMLLEKKYLVPKLKSC